MTIGSRIAAEALGLIGAPFRLRGRDPRTGIDCVGLALLAYGRAGLRVEEPPGYQLRGTSLARAGTMLRAAGLMPAPGRAAGDLLLVEAGPMQLHFMICASAGACAGHVHAHAGLGRVVLMPGASPWPVRGAWRADNFIQARQ